jgi:hypothetical protein
MKLKKINYTKGFKKNIAIKRMRMKIEKQN